MVAFIKGTKDFPQCGFSNTVVQILSSAGVPFETVDVLADEKLRSSLKEYSVRFFSFFFFTFFSGLEASRVFWGGQLRKKEKKKLTLSSLSTSKKKLKNTFKRPGRLFLRSTLRAASSAGATS